MLNFIQTFLKSALLLTRKIKDSGFNFEHGIDNLTEKFEVLPLLLLQICKGASQGTDEILLHQFLNINIHVRVSHSLSACRQRHYEC